ncbi:MAG TPA: hypothetical protein VK181_05510 [Rhizobium sp.]|nr:hypothetical protein [Rhizobium sp.]
MAKLKHEVAVEFSTSAEQAKAGAQELAAAFTALDTKSKAAQQSTRAVGTSAGETSAAAVPALHAVGLSAAALKGEAELARLSIAALSATNVGTTLNPALDGVQASLVGTTLYARQADAALTKVLARPAANTAAPQLSSTAAAAGTAAAAVGALPPKLREVEAAEEQVGRTGTRALGSVSSAAGNLWRTLTGVVSAYVGIYALQRTIGAAISDQVALENRQLAMASLINANMQFEGPNNFISSLSAGRSMLADLAQDAKRLPGSFSDFVSVAQSLSAPMLAQGVGLDELRRRTGQVAILASVTGAPTDVVGSQVARILQGSAGIEMEAWRQLQPYLKGMNAEKFNLLTPQQRYSLVFTTIEKIAADPQMLSLVARSASTEFSTLQENITGVTGILGIAGARIEDELVEQAYRLNLWFSLNEDKVRAIGNTIADHVVPAVRSLGDASLYVLENFDHIKAAAIGIAAAVAIYKTAGLLAPAGATGNLAKAGLMAFGTKATADLTPAATGAFGALLGRIGFGIVPATVVVPAAAVAAPAATSIGAMLAPIAPALPVIAAGLVIVAGIVAATAGAFVVVKNNVLGLGSFFNDSVGALGTSLGSLGASLGGLFMAVAVPLGVVLVPILSIAALALSAFVDVLTWSLDTIGGSVSAVSAFIGALTVNPFDIKGAAKIAKDEFSNFKFENLTKDLASYSQKQLEAREAEKKNVKGTSGPQTYINNLTVEQRIDRDANPDRIFLGVIREVERIRTQRVKLPAYQGY